MLNYTFLNLIAIKIAPARPVPIAWQGLPSEDTKVIYSRSSGGSCRRGIHASKMRG